MIVKVKESDDYFSVLPYEVPSKIDTMYSGILYDKQVSFVLLTTFLKPYNSCHIQAP